VYGVFWDTNPETGESRVVYDGFSRGEFTKENPAQHLVRNFPKRDSPNRVITNTPLGREPKAFVINPKGDHIELYRGFGSQGEFTVTVDSVNGENTYVIQGKKHIIDEKQGDVNINVSDLAQGFSLRVEFEGSTETTTESSDLDSFNYVDNSVNREKFADDVAEIVAHSDTCQEAVNKLSSEVPNEKLSSQVMYALENSEKLKSALLAHRLRELVEKANSYDDLQTRADQEDIRPDDKLYDISGMNRTLAEFVANIIDADSMDSTMTIIPEYCGMLRAINSAEYIEFSDGDKEEVDQKEELGGVGIPSTETESTTDQGPGSQVNYSSRRQTILESLVTARSIKDAVESLDRSFDEDDLIVDPATVAEPKKYTVGSIVDYLDRPTPHQIRNLQYIESADKKLSYAVHSLVLAEHIRRGSMTTYPSDLVSRVEDVMDKGGLSKSDSLYAGQTNEWTVDVISFGDVLQNTKQLAKLHTNESDTVDIERVTNRIPLDGGLRDAVLDIQSPVDEGTIRETINRAW